MTYEQCVATAFLNIINDDDTLIGSRIVKGRYGQMQMGDYDTLVYARRRLRVRAGLVP